MAQPINSLRSVLDVGLDIVPSYDDAHKQDQQNGDNGIGYKLEYLGRHGAILMQVGPHGIVTMGHSAQLVLDCYLRLTLDSNGCRLL